MKYFAILPILICLILLPMRSAGDIYRWVDKRGNLHFSDTPPERKTVFETQREESSPSSMESGNLQREPPSPSSSSGLYSGKPLYFWRDQFEMLNSKIAMKRRDIQVLESAINKTDMYQPERKAGIIIYPRELRVDGRLLNTPDQFVEERTRQIERLRELEDELHTLREKAKLAGLPPWVWEN